MKCNITCIAVTRRSWHTRDALGTLPPSAPSLLSVTDGWSLTLPPLTDTSEQVLMNLE